MERVVRLFCPSKDINPIRGGAKHIGYIIPRQEGANDNMKVSFKGNARVEGRLRGSGKARRRARKALARKIRKAVRRGLRDARRDLRRDLRTSFRRALRRELYSDRFANFLRNTLTDQAQWRSIAEGLLNEPVRVETIGGAISGVIIEVGEDYMILRETPNTILVVPFRSVNAIQPV